MKKILSVFALLILLTLVGCSSNANNGKINLPETEVNVEINDIGELPLELINIEAEQLEYSWDPIGIASMSGLYIIPEKPGEATLTVVSKLNKSITASIKIVIKQIVPEFNLSTSIFEIGKETSLRILNFSNNEFEWENSNPEVGSFNENQSFTALSKGITRITATHKVDPTITNTFTIDVIEVKPTITATNTAFSVGDEAQLYLENIYEYDYNDYIWEVSNADIISIDDNYIVTGLNNGQADVIVKHRDDERVTNFITFIVDDASIVKSPSGEPSGEAVVITGLNAKATVQAGEALEFEIAGALDLYHYKWSSTDTTIVQATDEGIIYGVKAGRAEVNIILKDALSVKARIIVNVVGEPNVDYRTKIVELAKAESGYEAGFNKNNKYGLWYPYNNVDWCAIFVSWAANQAGVSTDVIPKYALVQNGWDFYVKQNRAYLKSDYDYTPKAGDIIFYKNNPNDARLSHTGIVVSYEKGSDIIIAIEGNTTLPGKNYTNGAVSTRTRYYRSDYVYGFGDPAYPEYTK
jgi:hypothetical protein